LKISYNKYRYNVTLVDGFNIFIIKCHLFLLRIVRLFYRLLIYSKPLYIVIVSLIIYIVILFSINLDNKYSSLTFTIWDTRHTIFSVLFLAGFITLVSSEKQYHHATKIRYLIYVDIMRRYERLIKSIYACFDSTKLEPSTLYSEPINKRLVRKWNDLMESKESFESYKIYIEIVEKQLMSIESITSSLAQKIDTINSVWDNSHWDKQQNTYSWEEEIYILTTYITMSIDLIQKQVIQKKKDIFDETLYKLFIGTFSASICSMFRIVEHLRRPWRVDAKIDYKIVKILFSNSKDMLLSDFYTCKKFDINMR
jgi:hypothetical protein